MNKNISAKKKIIKMENERVVKKIIAYKFFKFKLTVAMCESQFVNKNYCKYVV